ncbi:MAG: LysM peptidoglycan-binding domain-containing protein [Bdellovibrionaceae bacterium]|nr:LysM peptidoglycan-binding domain-containing protein [Pseudobdellovibrionaceae bacterium]
MKSRLLFALILSASCFSASFAWAGAHKHEFKEGDTLWFLAQIYYGDGSQYTRILEDNKLKSPGAVRDGQWLQISSPLFTPDQPGFQARLTHLREVRARNLAKRLIASDSAATTVMAKEPAKTVVIPKYRPGIPSGLPWTEVYDTKTPTDEKAKAEIGGK